MKQLLLIGTTIFTLVAGSANAGIIPETETQQQTRPLRGNHTSVSMIHAAEARAEARAEELRQIEIQANTDRVAKAIKKLRSHVGKTWYVFSGATPSGWDCSGLTLWFYQQLGIELEHRASKQDTAGKETSSPKPGDIVIFHYNGSKDAYHVGIYIGGGKMIHAPKHGHSTRVESVKTFGGDYSDISYRTLIETN